MYRGAIRRKEQRSMVVGIGVDANRKQRVPKFRKCGNPGELEVVVAVPAIQVGVAGKSFVER